MMSRTVRAMVVPVSFCRQGFYILCVSCLQAGLHSFRALPFVVHSQALLASSCGTDVARGESYD